MHNVLRKIHSTSALHHATLRLANQRVYKSRQSDRATFVRSLLNIFLNIMLPSRSRLNLFKPTNKRISNRISLMIKHDKVSFHLVKAIKTQSPKLIQIARHCCITSKANIFKQQKIIFIYIHMTTSVIFFEKKNQIIIGKKTEKTAGKIITECAKCKKSARTVY